MSKKKVPHPAPLALLALFLSASGGCHLGVEMPTRARVIASVVGGAEGSVVRLITSAEFTSAPGEPESTELLRADTVQLSVPFDHEMEIGRHNGARKLYVELAPADGTELTVRMRVLIRGDPWYDVTLDMPQGRHRFLYMRF